MDRQIDRTVRGNGQADRQDRVRGNGQADRQDRVRGNGQADRQDSQGEWTGR